MEPFLIADLMNPNPPLLWVSPKPPSFLYFTRNAYHSKVMIIPTELKMPKWHPPHDATLKEILNRLIGE